MLELVRSNPRDSKKQNGKATGAAHGDAAERDDRKLCQSKYEYERMAKYQCFENKLMQICKCYNLIVNCQDLIQKKHYTLIMGDNAMTIRLKQQKKLEKHQAKQKEKINKV